MPGDADGKSRLRHRSRGGGPRARGGSRAGQRAAPRKLLPIQRANSVQDLTLPENVNDFSARRFSKFRRPAEESVTRDRRAQCVRVHNIVRGLFASRGR